MGNTWACPLLICGPLVRGQIPQRASMPLSAEPGGPEQQEASDSGGAGDSPLQVLRPRGFWVEMRSPGKARARSTLEDFSPGEHSRTLQMPGKPRPHPHSPPTLSPPDRAPALELPSHLTGTSTRGVWPRGTARPRPLASPPSSAVLRPLTSEAAPPALSHDVCFQVAASDRRRPGP